MKTDGSAAVAGDQCARDRFWKKSKILSGDYRGRELAARLNGWRVIAGISDLTP